MIATEGKRAGMVRRAARIFAELGSDPFAHRRLRDEAKAGNPYVIAKLAARGVYWDDRLGALVGVTPRPTDNDND